jgi:hypothetical protein
MIAQVHRVRAIQKLIRNGRVVVFLQRLVCDVRRL